MNLEELRTVGTIIGRFSDAMTLLVDESMGSDWAENEEILALLALGANVPPTTREVSQLSGLHRRAVTRLVSRLVDDGVATVARDPLDGRKVRVHLTPVGRRRMTALQCSMDEFFLAAQGDAARLVALLGCEGPEARSDAITSLDLLRHVVTAGVRLVDAITGPAARGRMAGRQRAALLQVAAAPEVALSSLSPSLGVSPSGATYVVDRLCERGLVARRRAEHPDDQRVVLLAATPAGRRAAAGVHRAIERERSALCALFAAVEQFDARGSTTTGSALTRP